MSEVVATPETDETVEPGETFDMTQVQPYVLDALGDDAQLTSEQYARALSAPDVKGGLRNSELRKYILDGDDARKEEKKARAAAKKAGKGRGGKGGTRAVAKGYDEWVGPAVLKAKALSAQKPGLDPDKHVPAAGPIQHVKVRHIVEKILNEEDRAITSESVLEVAGGKFKGNDGTSISLAQLKKIATFNKDAGKASLKPLRPLGQEFEGDGWAKGRYLASIIVPWVEDLRKQEKEQA